MLWLERNLSQEPLLNTSSENEEERVTTSLEEKCDKVQSNNWSLQSGTSGSGSTGQNAVRKVSFAPCEDAEDAYLSENAAVKFPSTSDDLECDMGGQNGGKGKKSRNSAKNYKCKPIYNIQPKLPRRDFPPPSPPAGIPLYTRSSRQLSSDKNLPMKQSYEKDLSHYVRKKLLALKLQEKAQKRCSRGRLLAVSSLSSSSDLNTKTSGKTSQETADALPIFQSTPEENQSLTDESNPTFYCTPKQSFCDHSLDISGVFAIDGSSNNCSSLEELVTPQISPKEGSVIKSSTHTISNSSSAPSFLINSSTQLCQCICDDDEFGSVEKKQKEEGDLSTSSMSHDQKKSLDLVENHEETEDSSMSMNSNMFYEAKADLSPSNTLSLVNEDWWKKLEKSYYNDPEDEMIQICKKSKTESAPENSIVDENVNFEPSSMKCRFIALADLLDSLYPEPEVSQLTTDESATHNSNEESTPEEILNDSCECDKDIICEQVALQMEPSDECFEEVEECIEEQEYLEKGSYEEKDFEEEESFEEEECSEVEECLEEKGGYEECFEVEECLEEKGGYEEGFECLKVEECLGEKGGYEEGFEEEERLKVEECLEEEGGSYEVKKHEGTNCDKEMVLLQEKVSENDDYNDHLEACTDSPVSTNLELSSEIFEDERSTNLNEHDLKNSEIEIEKSSLCSSEEDGNMKEHTTAISNENEVALLQSGNNSLSEDEASFVIQNDTFVLDSLHCATDILKNSHDSLAKSVHSLCRGAFIKQSNISLQLVLPIDHKCSDENESTENALVVPSNSTNDGSMVNLQLNSSIVYSPTKSEAKICMN